jgi:hypothetical protein
MGVLPMGALRLNDVDSSDSTPFALYYQE